MKLRSNVCNRRRFVFVKFYLKRLSFAVVIAKCLGAHFFGTHCKPRRPAATLFSAPNSIQSAYILKVHFSSRYW